MDHFVDNWPLGREAVVELLKEHAIQPTQQRMEIAQILFARPQHLSADQVLAAVNADGSLVSKATVYNTLGLFAEKGLVREVIVDPNRVFYDSNTSTHHHFYNVDTGALTDIDADEVAINGLPSLPAGTLAEGVEVIIRVRQEGGDR
ncbi:MAG: Fur family transcriptional regulator [Gammaproteobacteria bacterium]